MKKLIFSILLCCSNFVFSQTVNNIPLKDIDVDYIQIIGTYKTLSTKMVIDIDFGQKTKLISFGEETVLRDENGMKMTFNSMIDALNFLSKQGYEFVNAYAFSHDNQTVYHYILKKKK